jgi:hypothetical protein
MQTIFKKCPSKENCKLSKLFRLILRGLNLPLGSDSPQNKILQLSDLAEQDPVGIRPRGTKSRRVSDPAEQLQRCIYYIADTCSVGSDTPQNNILRGLILCLTKSCGISDPAEQSSAGYHTPGNNFKRLQWSFCLVWRLSLKEYSGPSHLLISLPLDCWLLFALTKIKPVSNSPFFFHVSPGKIMRFQFLQ